jgi:hypothetical protein
MVAWARKYGINSTIHTGGPSIPGSGLIDKDVVLEADTDVIGHINGGHTALPDDQIRMPLRAMQARLELVHNGNERAALVTLRTAKELDQLDRVILGTDAPAGSGVQPLGILRMISMLASLGEVSAETAFCFATGNTAKLRALDCGLIEVGRAADFVFLDRAQHSAGKTLLDSVALGDLPGVGMTVIDGIVRSQRSRNTPPATKVPSVVGAWAATPEGGRPATSILRAAPKAQRVRAQSGAKRLLGDARGERPCTRSHNRNALGGERDQHAAPSAGSGLVLVKPRLVRRSMTPLIVAASIAVKRPSRFCEDGPISLSLASAAHCVGVRSSRMCAAKMAV